MTPDLITNGGIVQDTADIHTRLRFESASLNVVDLNGSAVMTEGNDLLHGWASRSGRRRFRHLTAVN